MTLKNQNKFKFNPKQKNLLKLKLRYDVLGNFKEKNISKCYYPNKKKKLIDTKINYFSG